MRRKRTFRGRSRSQWRNQAWGFTPIGDLNANEHFGCPTLLPPGSQAFFPVLTNQMFGPDPNIVGGDAPFKQERVLCLRTMGDVDLYYTANVNQQTTSQYRWVLALLDEEAVSDVAYQFPSLFLPTFHQAERVLLTGIADHCGQYALPSTNPDPDQVFRSTARIKWDQKLRTKVETGSTLWLVVEGGFCDDANPQPMQLSAYALGFTRALWRD